LNFDGVKILFCHYPFIIEDGKFKCFINFDDKIDKSVFSETDADLYVFGHQHKGSDKVDSEGIRYINLSSAGTTRGNETTYSIIQIHDNSFEVIMKNVRYDRSKTIVKMDQLGVPEKEFIKRVFFGT
jgi:predicted phosphodiesterase